MPDSIISALPAASPLTPFDLVPGVQGGVTKSFSIQQLLAAANAASMQVPDYATLRAVTSSIQTVFVTGYLASAAPSAISGLFTRDDSDVSSADNGGTIIVASNGKRWKRVFSGPMDVHWFGAKGDGSTDDTSAIQAALNACAAAGGGTVLAPPGRFVLTSKLTIPSYVLLLGSGWIIDPSNSAGSSKDSVLVINWGAAQDNHAVEMSFSSGIEGFSFYYPGQAAKNATTPVQFGYSISTPLAAGPYDNIHVKNINLYNSYKGIRLNNGGRWRVENVQGNPLSVGFSADQCLDVCYMRAVHFWNFYTQSDVLETWVAANGTAFDFKRIDQLHAEGLFGWNYNVCFSLGASFWGSLANILSDKANTPLLVNGVSQAYISNFVLISSSASKPAVWMQSGGIVSLSNGQITSTAGVGVQVDGGSTVRLNAVDFSNQHAAVVATNTSTDVYLTNCKYAIPPFGGYNVRVNGERLSNDNTAVTLPTPLVTPTAISGGYQFDLSTAGAKTLQWETTYISQRNSLWTLEFDYELVGSSSTWNFQLSVQTDIGSNTQVSFAPAYPMILNGTSGSPKRVRIPFFINHGRFKQVLTVTATPTVTVAGASLKMTNIALYEQDSKYTTDAQVSGMMRNGYNLDGYGMGQTLFSKGPARRIFTNPESGIGRSGATPTAGAWNVGDEILLIAPTAGSSPGVVCTTAGDFSGTAPVFKALPALAA